MEKLPRLYFLDSMTHKMMIGAGEVSKVTKWPVVYITPFKAQQFVDALSVLDREATYRLPTGNEWEYAARGGDHHNTTYFWGDNFNSTFAYFNEEHVKDVSKCPLPALNSIIDDYCVNDFGLIHTLGNSQELTREGDDFIARGGSWKSSAEDLGLSVRNPLPPKGDGTIGFRVMRVPKEK